MLKWVTKEGETEVKAAFAKTLVVRTKGTEARELADQYFFETLVRIHREGEGEPFTGLHARLDALASGHEGRLDALHAHLAEPRRALDCFTVLFGRKIDGNSLGLATGEAMAHLRHLEVTGRAVREERDGVYWYRAAA